MPEFKAKICTFSLHFIAFSMREMRFGEVREYGQKNDLYVEMYVF